MTVHSGTFGPVHTGIVSDIKLFGARRLQRRLEPRSTTSATGRAGVFHRRAAPPHSPVQASLSARTSTFRLTSSWPNHVRDHPPATFCGSPFLVEPRAGSPPWRYRSPSPPSRVCPFTLRGLLQVRGLVDSSLRQRGSSAIPLTRCSGSLSLRVWTCCSSSTAVF